MGLAAKRSSDAESTFKIAFNVDKEANPELGFGIYVTLSAADERSAEKGNTMTASFRPMVPESGRLCHRASKECQSDFVAVVG